MQDLPLKSKYLKNEAMDNRKIEIVILILMPSHLASGISTYISQRELCLLNTYTTMP